MSRLNARALCALVGLLAAASVWGQQTATVSGIVTDSTAAVVPGVEINLVNEGTGESYTATTNAVGAYTIPFIKPGTYNLSASSTGFKQYNRTGIVVDTAAIVRIDMQLELGEVTEVVTVEAEVPLLKTDNSSVGAVIKNRTIINMPLINRRAAQLVRLSGFVVQRGNGAQFMIGGGRGNNAMWTLDGGSTQNMMLGVNTLSFDPPIEALDEIQVEVSNYKAEMGRTGSGFIQMSTKSGTNEYHGVLYEFLRNDALDSRQFFAADKQKLRRNQFGWAFGGPIKKDRTFFFASQEFILERTSNPRIENIPDPAETRGDFSGLGRTIRDPMTREPVPNNIIPQSQLDPVGVEVAKFWPAPNIANRPSRNRNYFGMASTPLDVDTFAARLDHTISDKHRLYGRYVHNRSDREENGGIWPLPVHANSRNVTGRYFNVSVTGISNLTPRLIAEYRYTWNHRKFHPVIPAKGLGFAQQIGIQGVDTEYFPGFGFTGGIQRIGRAGGQERLQFPIRDQHIMNNWTYVAGNHTFKWGWEFRASRNDDVNLPTAGGSFNFNQNATGDSIAALLYGWTQRGQRVQTLLIRSRMNTVGSYVQDDWRVTPKLTLNLGLRYDLDTPRWEAIDNRQNSFDEQAINPACNCPGVVTWSGRTARGGSRYAHNFNKLNFAPRFGFAYKATGNWVIRGGGSLVYMGLYDQATPIAVNAGFSINGDFVSPDAGMTPPFLLREGLPPIPVPTDADLTPSFGAAPIGGQTFFSPQFFQPEDRPVPYLITYNFNIQRQLPWQMLFEVGYLSTVGKKLTAPGSMTVNQVHPTLIGLVDEGARPQDLRPFPQFSNVVTMAPTVGSSAYHGVNLKLEKRYSSGLQFTTNYTFSRALDDVHSRNELGGEGNVPFADQYNRRIAWSLAGNHIKHRFIVAPVWELPWGRGRAHSLGNPVLNQIAGGWTVGTIIEARTGPPFGALWGNAGQVYPTAARVRAQINGEFQANPNWRENVLGEAFFDTSNFSRPPRFTFGNVGRNAFIGPGALRADLSIIKHIYLPFEGHDLQFRTEMINFPNRANFGLPNNDANNRAFGAINGLTPGASGRIIQFGLRYAF